MSTISLTNAKFAFLNQGAIIQEISVDGHNVVLSFPTPAAYFSAPYFGESIGRVANRIKNGMIDNLNGRSYQLATNERNQTHLHGGTQGWGRKQFTGPHAAPRRGRDAVRFTYVSPDGDEGYPGTVEFRVWYTAYEKVEQDVTKNVLDVEYEVEFVGDECEETVVNVTNHSYFNIGHGPTIAGTELTVYTTDHLLTNSDGIPTGDTAPFAGIEAGKSFLLDAKEPLIDHCFIFPDALADLTIDTRAQPLKHIVSASNQASGIHFDVFSTEPAFQLYTGDFTAVAPSVEGPARGARSGFCVEPSRFVNAVNVPDWRSQVVLRQGHIYGSRISYTFWTS